MGDAAHLTLPFLARLLDTCPDVPSALVRYENARLERTARVVG